MSFGEAEVAVEEVGMVRGWYDRSIYLGAFGGSRKCS